MTIDNIPVFTRMELDHESNTRADFLVKLYKQIKRRLYCQVKGTKSETDENKFSWVIPFRDTSHLQKFACLGAENVPTSVFLALCQGRYECQERYQLYTSLSSAPGRAKTHENETTSESEHPRITPPSSLFEIIKLLIGGKII